MRFIFLTKTPWNEPPRLRHQLARLLDSAGHTVVFFEKPIFFWQKMPSSCDAEGNIRFYRYRELIHHKLRISRLLYNLNAWFVTKELGKAFNLIGLNQQDMIVNFNYDYGFLRKIFPKHKLLTVINDDFHSRALWNYQKPLLAALEKTCKSSDVVLTVSELLKQMLAQFCKPELFLPWTECPYMGSPQSGSRSLLLFWGYINSKIDFALLSKFSKALNKSNPHMRILFVGPLQLGSESVRILEGLSNVDLKNAASLDTLPMDRVLAALIPYRNNVPAIDAISFPNKAFQLLAYGVPLLISGMPNFLKASFVFRTIGDAGDDIDLIRRQFTQLQPVIQDFLSQNSPRHRLSQFLSYLE